MTLATGERPAPARADVAGLLTLRPADNANPLSFFHNINRNDIYIMNICGKKCTC